MKKQYDKKNISSYHKLPILDGLELLNAKAHTLNFPNHTHDTFNIALILDNTFNTKLTNKFIKAPKGTLAITNPNEIHATPCDILKGNSFFTFYISPEVLKTINNGRSVYFENRTIYDTFIFNELYYLSLNFNKGINQFENRLFYAMVSLVNKYGVNEAFERKTTNLFQTFINEIEDIEKFSLEKTASQFGLNKFKFLRLFKQETGLTPNNFILLKRIEKSKKMLINGKPIFDTAIDLGFHDSSHFYKDFRRFTGVTPLVYQNSI